MNIKNNIFTALGRIFSSEIDVEDYNNDDIITMNPELLKTLQDLENKEKEAEESFNSNKNSGGKSLKKKYQAPQPKIEEMTPEKLEKMTKILGGEEIEK